MPYQNSVGAIDNSPNVPTIYNHEERAGSVDDAKRALVVPMRDGAESKGTFINTQSEYTVWLVHRKEGTSRLGCKILLSGQRDSGYAVIIDMKKAGGIDSDGFVYRIPNGTTFEIQVWAAPVIAGRRKLIDVEPSSWRDRARMLLAWKTEGKERYGAMNLEHFRKIMGNKELRLYGTAFGSNGIG
jgi:hypothetical protein